MKDFPFIPGYRHREAKRANASGLEAMRVSHLERAEMLFRYAVTLYPQAWGAWLNLGNAVGNRGRHQEALRHYHHAHTLAPLEHAPRVNAAYALLHMGDWKEGWALYEERWRDPVFKARTAMYTNHGQRWDGVKRSGKSLLVFSEQGAGDVLMMFRYWGALMLTEMDLVLRVPASLYRLVRRNMPPSVDVIMDTERVPPHDYHVPFMSLPYMFRTWKAEDIPGAEGYLSATPREYPPLSVGLVWAGNPNHKADAHRSMPFDALAPLRTIPGITWVSLQFGEAAKQSTWAMLTPDSRDFSETARVIAGLDCVVTVDTAVAHLAGALGIPALAMLAQPNDWRWGAEGKSTPWYTSMSLYRQRTPGDWGPVVADVKWVLQELVGVRRVA